MAKEQNDLPEPILAPKNDENPPLNESRIDNLKKKINNKEYLNEAIQRIANVMSNEIADVPANSIGPGGGAVERKRQ